MCNLYSVTKGQAAIRDLFAVKHDRAGDLPLLPAVFPDQMAPIVRVGADGERELVMARWGMPGPVRRSAGHERQEFEERVLEPMARKEKPMHRAGNVVLRIRAPIPQTPVWFALAEDRPLFAFAGLGRTGADSGTRERAVDGAHEVFCFLATEANATVAPIHPKGMPVILTSPEEVDRGFRRKCLPRSRCNGPCRMTRCGSWRRARGRMARRQARNRFRADRRTLRALPFIGLRT